MTIFALVTSAVAILIAAYALWCAYQHKGVAEQAAHSAHQTETLLHTINHRTDRTTQRRTVIWGLQKLSDSAYLLRNEGTHAAYDVHLQPRGIDLRGPSRFDTFAAGHAERYLLFRPLDSNHTSLTVSWQQEADLTDQPRVRDMPVA